MEAVALELASYLVERIKTLPPGSRLLVGLSGAPSSGKTTLAKSIASHANALLEAEEGGSEQQRHGLGARAIAVGQDGWHFTRAQLDAFPDPELAHARRGAHWTFDGENYLAFVKQLCLPNLNTAISASHPNGPASASEISDGSILSKIMAPSFDHAVKDPAPDSIHIYPHHRIVLIEGLYTFLGLEPWKAAGEVLHERWFIDVGEEEATRRLVHRHVLTGISKDAEEALKRAKENDIPNGRYITANMLEPTRRIISINDPL